MKNEKVFSTMSPECARFYHRLFNEVLVNLYAVKDGLFDTFICDIEDPQIMNRWRNEAPMIIEVMIMRSKKE
jgi:hypothetical protein